jgi:hypothetical protein
MPEKRVFVALKTQARSALRFAFLKGGATARAAAAQGEVAQPFDPRIGALPRLFETSD